MMPLAQTPPSDAVISWLIGTPITVLAFLVVAFIQGWVVPGRLHNRRLAELDALTEQMRLRDKAYEEKVIPALTLATAQLAKAAERERTG